MAVRFAEIAFGRSTKELVLIELEICAEWRLGSRRHFSNKAGNATPHLRLESRAVIDLVNIPSLNVCFEVFDGAQVFRFGLHRLEIEA